MTPVEVFASAARRFIELVDSFAEIPIDQRTEHAAISLAALYAAAISLPATEPKDVQVESFKVDLPARWPGFAENRYFEVFDPLVEDDPVGGDLADDFRDVYRDVRRGLTAYDRGLVEDAVCYWRFQFEIHWGDHAVDALRALHRILTRQRNGEKVRLTTRSDGA
jgi:hypothetical protein